MRPTDFTSSTGSRLAGLLWPGDSTRTIVLVHGLASNARTWLQVAEILNGDGAQVVAYDQRSHGRSERVTSGFDFGTYAADLQAVITSITDSPPVTVGQSWGGNVVVEHAAHFSSTDVIGIDGGFIRLAHRFASWEECATRLAPPRFADTTRRTIEGRLRSFHPDWSDSAIEGALGNFEDQPNGSVLPYLPYEQHMKILRSMWEHDPVEALAKATARSHAIVARPGSVSEPDVRQVGFDEVVSLDGDHDLHLQQPETVAKLILGMTSWDL